MAEQNKSKNILKNILKLLYYIVIVFVGLIAIFLIIYIISSQIHSKDENYKPRISLYTIVSPSMTPVIKVYDVVLNIKVNNPKDIKVGDIITYISSSPTSEGMTITHRVIDIEKLPDGTYEYLTQGDNNSEPDNNYIDFDSIIGKEILIIPFVGRLQFLIANQKGWLFLLLIPVAIYTFIEIYKLLTLFGLKKKVDKVVIENDKEQKERKRSQLINNNFKKQMLKNELNSKVVNKDALIKNDKEPSGFLDNYSDTIVNVKENKYNKIKDNENIIREATNLVRPSNVSNDLEMTARYEILDTDELTSKIKEYDEKIEKLDKMLKDISGIDFNNSDKDEEEVIEEQDNYLKDRKIKVVSVENTKNSPNYKNKNRDIPPKNISKKDIQINVMPILPKVNNINKDTSNILPKQASKNPTPKKAKLNLNPKKVKKINRKGKK